MAVITRNTVVYDVPQYILVQVHRLLECPLSSYIRIISIDPWITLLPSRWRQKVPPKHQ
jgi:hypothetical protein